MPELLFEVEPLVDDLPLFVSEVLPSFLELDFAFVVEVDFASVPEVEADVLPLLDEVEPMLLPVPIEDPDPEVNPELDEEPEELVPEPLMPEPLMLDEPWFEELWFDDPLDELPDMLLP
ncbi:hypothetical protein [Pontibacter ruber]|uniref:Uncharacterized protein n=1 Tax=Pontibacter ruber TaxID=1343895 RepID=A0ABW5CUE9_9BACT|nr:hypothetical protein [Pontibacter ruber]